MKIRLTEKKRILVKNTAMMYVLTFSTYLMQFLVVPYETRILHAEKYGLLNLVKAVMVYFNLLIDFGFHLSATEQISLYREDRRKVSEIFTAVTLNKLMIAAAGAVLLGSLCGIIPRWRQNALFFFLFYAATVMNSLIPDYLYRGIEQMGVITVRVVSVKLFFTCMIFLLLHGPEDYYVEAWLTLIGNTAALSCTLIHLLLRMGVRFIACTPGRMWKNLRDSAMFFISGIASTLYTSANTIILDFLSAGSATAFYAGAEKLVVTAQNGFSPVSDSLYPYMTRNRDFKLIRNVLLIMEPVVISGCAVAFVFARPLCTWFFGAEYAPMAPILRAMLPMIALILPNYLLSFPTLSAMGLTKYAAVSVFFGSGIHLVNLFLFYLKGNLNMVTLAALSSVTEAVILLFRIAVILKNKDKLKMGGDAF